MRRIGRVGSMTGLRMSDACRGHADSCRERLPPLRVVGEGWGGVKQARDVPWSPHRHSGLRPLLSGEHSPHSPKSLIPRRPGESRTQREARRTSEWTAPKGVSGANHPATCGYSKALDPGVRRGDESGDLEFQVENLDVRRCAKKFPCILFSRIAVGLRRKDGEASPSATARLPLQVGKRHTAFISSPIPIPSSPTSTFHPPAPSRHR